MDDHTAGTPAPPADQPRAQRAENPLASIPPDTAADRYGAGAVVAEQVAEIAALLEQSAPSTLPTRTSAQQAVLRKHA